MEDSSVEKDNTTLQYLLASSLAGITARIATHPFDTFKTLLQSEQGFVNECLLLAAKTTANLTRSFFISFDCSSSKTTTGGEGGTAGSSSPATRGSIRELLRTRQVSLWQLYRGVGVACLFHAPALSVYLTTYDTSKKLMAQRLGPGWEESSAVFLASGCFAEVMSGIFWTPMEVIKQHMQITALQRGAPTQTSWELAKQTVRAEGFFGLYRGYLLTLGVFVPYTMIYFVTYEKLKVLQRERLKLASSNDLPFSSYLLCSALAGEKDPHRVL